MSESNKVTIGRSPHDEECLINGLIRDFENAKKNNIQEDLNSPIWIGLPIEKDAYVNISGEIAAAHNQTQD